MSQLFWNLLLAHVIGDFYCQTGRSCTGKREQGLLGIDLYVHAFIILVLSWVAKAVKRTYPSPDGPKPTPGVHTTLAP